MKVIFYIGNFDFPNGNAAGKRVYGNGKLLQKLGYKVVYIGTSRNEINKNLIHTKKTFDGFDYYNFRYPKKYKDWLLYRKDFDQFVKLVKIKYSQDEIIGIVYYDSPTISLFTKKLINYSNKNNFKIISDCVDWLAVRTNSKVFDFFKWLDTTYMKTYLNKKTDGIIVISTYLQKYYGNFHKKTLILPPLSTTRKNNDELKFHDCDYPIICYAGIPFRNGQKVVDFNSLKDRIDIILEVLVGVKRNGIKFKFDIYGFIEKDYLIAFPTQSDIIKELNDYVEFHGLVSNEEVTKNLTLSNFTILFRNKNRMSMAGFPTKVSESLTYGTPVITNNTSDLGNYILNGKNGYIVSSASIDELTKDVSEILSMKQEKNHAMKRYCHNHSPFYFEEYKEETTNFFDSL